MPVLSNADIAIQRLLAFKYEKRCTHWSVRLSLNNFEVCTWYSLVTNLSQNLVKNSVITKFCGEFGDHQILWKNPNIICIAFGWCLETVYSINFAQNQNFKFSVVTIGTEDPVCNFLFFSFWYFYFLMVFIIFSILCICIWYYTNNLSIRIQIQSKVALRITFIFVFGKISKPE